MPEYLKRPKPVSDELAADVRATVTEILRAVEQEGIVGVRRYSERLDGWNPDTFRVSSDEIDRATAAISDELREHIDFSIAQVSDFARRQRASLSEFEAETLPGVWLGQKHIPIDAVGAYSPGGRYPLIASAIMTVAVPKVAGVPRVVAAAPPSAGGGIHPPQLYAMAAAGADEIVRRIDQGQMRQSLGKIPQLSFRRRIVLFRQQTNVVAQREKSFKQFPRFVIATQQDVIVSEPERAGQE